MDIWWGFVSFCVYLRQLVSSDKSRQSAWPSHCSATGMQWPESHWKKPGRHVSSSEGEKSTNPGLYASSVSKFLNYCPESNLFIFLIIVITLGRSENTLKMLHLFYKSWDQTETVFEIKKRIIIFRFAKSRQDYPNLKTNCVKQSFSTDMFFLCTNFKKKQVTDVEEI